MKSMKNNNHHKHRRPLQLPLLLLLLLLLPLSESAQRARRGWWARGGLPVVVEGEEPPEGEVEDMIASTLRRQLPGCHKVIVSDRHPVRNVMKALGEEVFVWEMQPLLASLPPPRPLLRTTHRQGGAAPLCVAFVILAPLQVVAAAMEGLQRGEWFQGARKLVFAYTGFANTSLEAAVERHATLRVIGAVQRLEADFSLNVAFTGDRERVIDYTLGYYNDPLTFCTSPPRPLPRVLALVRPFHPEVWAGFVVALVAVGSLYYAARKLENSSSSVPSFLATFLKIYGSCLTQSQKWETGGVGQGGRGRLDSILSRHVSLLRGHADCIPRPATSLPHPQHPAGTGG
ncbi:hypothetical protein O3P69_012536 [Scylla paramamosain]|uniref:Variant Ionotropic Glutamate Receptor n=1 Tax=Scylla paramamosain TaxID=85552 RepID=A0AAW0SHY9_SCYPA